MGSFVPELAIEINKTKESAELSFGFGFVVSDFLDSPRDLRPFDTPIKPSRNLRGYSWSPDRKLLALREDFTRVWSFETGELLWQGDTADKRIAYDCDVTYGTGHEFGFDYLRDQLTLRSAAAATLGSRLLEDLRAKGPGQRSTMQRGLAYAVIDEADSVLGEDAGSPLVLSMATTGQAGD